MGVYTRFKKAPGGFRNLVVLLETTPLSRRKNMIDVGMMEDPEYTQRALKYMMNFEDILGLPDPELAEVIGDTPAELVAFAIHSCDEELKTKFLRMAMPKMVPTIREILTLTATNQQISGGRSKMIEAARKLEKRGIVKTKHIPD